MLKKAFGVDCLSDRQIFRWHKAFAEGGEDVNDENRAGRSSTSSSEDNVKHVRDLLNTDRRLSVRLISETLDITKTIVHEIVSESLGMRKVCAKLVPKLVSKFSTTGSVGDKPRSGRPTIGEDTQVKIVAEMVVTPQQTTESIARTCGGSATTVKRALRKPKFHPYKMQYLQCLTEDDPDRRIEFCELMTNRIDNNPSYLIHVCFSDESTFYLKGKVNRQNMRYWSDVNPYVFREGHSQYPEKLNVWAGIMGDHIV
ncbi:hypothetical protein NQ318_017041 [Aromia moschata]|uniref:Transposase n=1 Tax=Aromia moschata TaxID=1265417 RepID=A0AAV8XCC0_9CUCU|nr:hypothetical protein NQ318_017041 [Aromia moschata]